jgi:hypothetical protein
MRTCSTSCGGRGGGGGVVLEPLDQAFNFRLDMDAARRVFAALQAWVPVTAVGKFCARKAALRRQEDFDQLLSREMRLLTELHLAWFKHTDQPLFQRIYAAAHAPPNAPAPLAGPTSNSSSSSSSTWPAGASNSESKLTGTSAGAEADHDVAGLGAMAREILRLTGGDDLSWLAQMSLPFDPLCITAMLHPQLFSRATCLRAAAPVSPAAGASRYVVHTLIGASADEADSGFAERGASSRAYANAQESGADADRCRAHVLQGVRAGEAFYLAREPA